MVGFGDSTTIQCPTKKPELNPTLTVWFTNDVTKVAQKILIATLGFEGGNTKGKSCRASVILDPVRRLRVVPNPGTTVCCIPSFRLPVYRIEGTRTKEIRNSRT